MTLSTQTGSKTTSKASTGTYPSKLTDLVDVIRRKLIQNHKGRVRGDEVRACCPVHHGTHKRTFSFNVNKGAWNCFKCGACGNIVQLAGELGVLEKISGSQRARIAEFRSQVEQYRWPGIAGATDREVLVAISGLALRLGSVELTFSDRQLGELAGVSRRTARRSVQRLCDRRWLRQLRSGQGRQASAYRLHLLRRVHSGDTNKVLSCSEGTIGTEFVHHDATRWRALGKNTRLLLSLLRSREWRIADLAHQAGVHRNTVRLFLRRAEPLGLVVRVGSKSWTAGQLSATALNAAAEHFGTLGDGERQRSQHEIDRTRYRHQLAENQQRRGTRLVMKATAAS